jgi:hypothetical protein
MKSRRYIRHVFFFSSNFSGAHLVINLPGDERKNITPNCNTFPAVDFSLHANRKY